MSYIFLLDTRKCIGCGACAVACMDQNDVQPQEGDEPFRQCFVIEQGSGKDAPLRTGTLRTGLSRRVPEEGYGYRLYGL